MKKILMVHIIILIGIKAFSAPFEYRYAKHFKYVYHKHNESSFQHAYCSLHNGIEEYELPDKTKVDCLTDKYAIEFDFANKAYEVVGQALHYSLMTGKQAKIVLILDKDKQYRQLVYVNRIKNIGSAYGITVEYITDDILQLDRENKCSYSDCKCHRKKHMFSSQEKF